MKKLNKFAGLLLALVLTFALATTAMAADPLGSITINGVSTEGTYQVYKLLDLSLGMGTGAYSYTVNSDWAGFFATAEALAYVEIDSAGYVKWSVSEEDSVVAEFAKKALAYAKANGIAPVQTTEITGSHPVSDMVITGTSGKFSDLELGYYLVDSSMGALCGLTTTNPDASVNAKNVKPVVEKHVQEDSNSQWLGTNTADIGQIVNFRTTIYVHAGAENLILHDVMESSFSNLTVSDVQHVIPGGTSHSIDAALYTVTPNADGFTLTFDDAVYDDLSVNDQIHVYYSAMLNRNAEIAGGGNLNTTWLTYGDGHDTVPVQTTTYTYQIQIVKTDSTNTPLVGATFKIYDAAVGGNLIPVVPLRDSSDVLVKDSKGQQVYRRARTDEGSGETIVMDAAGIVTVVGLDNGVYYLEEVTPPSGYNALTARQKFTVSDANLDAVFNDSVFSTGSGVHVVNKTGEMLPETGGMGTVLFITFGMLVVMGTGVLLVTKKRMAMIED